MTDCRPRAMPRVATPLSEPDRVAAIFDRFAAAVPDPTPDYPAATPFELLVTVAASAQSTDAAVLRATRPLFAAAATPAAMLRLGQAAIEAHLRPLGLFRTKARAIFAAARMLQDRFGGEVPLDRASLESLPGVGPKTASIVLHRLGVAATIAVDTHVLRVAHRLALAAASGAGVVERELLAIVPRHRHRHAHDWLVRHGKTVCHPRRPACRTCLVADLCPAAARVTASAA